MLPAATLRQDGIAPVLCSTSSPSLASPCLVPLVLKPTVGTPVASLADAKPGDILANGTHAAIYIGNGQVMNAMNPVQGTAVSDVSVFGGAGYSIRRVM